MNIGVLLELTRWGDFQDFFITLSSKPPPPNYIIDLHNQYYLYGSIVPVDYLLFMVYLLIIYACNIYLTRIYSCEVYFTLEPSPFDCHRTY
nr:MAG TPA: hypothetical protein [Caudoviricetes sp.]